MAQILPAIEAFAAKNGWDDRALFDPARFQSKGVALSCVAVWAAIKDVWKIEICLTPGQVATIVDGAPIIVGSDGLDILEGVRPQDPKRPGRWISAQETLSEFVIVMNQRWKTAATTLSQIWSLTRVAQTKMPNDYLLNSQYTDAHVAQVAIMSAVVEKGFHNTCANPGALLRFLDHKTGKPAQIVKLASAGRIAIKPESPADKAATILALAKNGYFSVISRSCFLDEYVEAAMIFVNQNKNTPCDYTTDGAFLGPRNLEEIRVLASPMRQSSESADEYLARIPGYSYGLTCVKKFAFVKDDDRAWAVMQGTQDALDRFSPLVLRVVSS